MKKIFSILFGLGLAAFAGVQAQSTTPATTDANAPMLTMPAAFSAPATPANSTSTLSANTTPAGDATITPAPAPVKIHLSGIELERESSDPNAAFSAGLAAYAKGDFARARAHFEAAEMKSVTAALEYNFGNACYSAGDNGEAILHYLRALSLNPGDPDARQNLALARQALNIAEPEPTRLDSFAGIFKENTWTWLATFAGWTAIYLAFLPRLYKWGGLTPKILCATMALVAIGAAVGVWGARQHAHDGVVLHADTPLKLSPTSDSGSIGVVQAGEIAQVIDTHSDYYKVQTADGHEGWVDNTSYAPVWE